MPQLQNLVLTDRAPTPVNHTFSPFDIDANGVGVVTEAGSVPIGESRYTVGITRASNRYKVTLRMTVPIVQTQTINGVSTPVVVRRGHVDCVFTFDQTSSEQERKDVVGMFADSLGSGKVLTNDVLTKLQGIY